MTRLLVSAAKDLTSFIKRLGGSYRRLPDSKLPTFLVSVPTLKIKDRWFAVQEFRGQCTFVTPSPDDLMVVIVQPTPYRLFLYYVGSQKKYDRYQDP